MTLNLRVVHAWQNSILITKSICEKNMLRNASYINRESGFALSSLNNSCGLVLDTLKLTLTTVTFQ